MRWVFPVCTLVTERGSGRIWNLPEAIISSRSHTHSTHLYLGWLAACLAAAAFQGLKGTRSIFMYFREAASEARALRYRSRFAPFLRQQKDQLDSRPFALLRALPAPFMRVKCEIIKSFTCQKIPALFSQVRSQRETKPWMKTRAVHTPESASRQITQKYLPSASFKCGNVTYWKL